MTDDEKALNDLGGDAQTFDLMDPDNLPTDPEALAKLMGEGEQAPDEPEPDDTPGSSPEAVQSDDEAPILSADGKHAIPYQVLKQEREAKRAALERAQELERQILALQAKAEQEPVPQADTTDSDELDESAQAFLDEFPEVAKITKAQRAEIERLRREMQERDAKLSQVASFLEAQQAERQRAEIETVQAAIDANPVLSYLRTGDADPQLWNAAVAIDQELQQRPKWAGVSHADRFAEVVRRLETDYGPVALPSSYRASLPPAKSPAKTAVQRQAARPPIETLSDLAGGSSPEAGETNLEAMSSADLIAKFSGLSYEQLQQLPERILARL